MHSSKESATELPVTVFKNKTLKDILEVCRINMLGLWSSVLTCDLTAVFLGAFSTLAAAGDELQSKCMFVTCLQGVMISSHKYTWLSVTR